MFAFYENKIYGDYMETKARRQTAREHLVRNEEAAGAIPAESIIRCMHPEKVLYLA